MKYLLIALSFWVCTVSSRQVNAQASSPAALPPVQTAGMIDLQQYLGTWFEIAAIPESFEKQCVGNTTAVYGLAENGLISVVNSCDTASGKRSVATGRAEVIDRITNSKLKVTFVSFFGWQFMFSGDYWILAVGDNYSYAVVAEPGRNSAWILSRTSTITQAQLAEATQVLVQQGFDVCKLITTIQTPGLQTRTPLCQLLISK